MIKQPRFLPERLTKGALLTRLVPPFDAARRGDSRTLIGSFIGWILIEICTIKQFKGGRVGIADPSLFPAMPMPLDTVRGRAAMELMKSRKLKIK